MFRKHKSELAQIAYILAVRLWARDMRPLSCKTVHNVDVEARIARTVSALFTRRTENAPLTLTNSERDVRAKSLSWFEDDGSDCEDADVVCILD